MGPTQIGFIFNIFDPDKTGILEYSFSGGESGQFDTPLYLKNLSKFNTTLYNC